MLPIAGIHDRHWGERSRDRYVLVVKELILNRIQEKTEILDIGCGTGHLLRQLTDLGFYGTGVGISSSRIEKA